MQLTDILTTTVNTFLIGKLLFILILAVLYNYIKGKVPGQPIRLLKYVWLILVARDLLYSAIYLISPFINIGLRDSGFILVISDILVLGVYLIWLRQFTGKRRYDLVFFGLNAVFFVLIIVNLWIKLNTQYAMFEKLVPHLWIIADIIYLGITLYGVTVYNTEEPVMVMSIRLEIIRIPVISQLGILVALLFFQAQYYSFFIQYICIPFSYFLHLFVLYKYNIQHEKEQTDKFNFLQNDLDSLFEFMRNLGSAIAEKLDLSQILSFIIASATKSTNADAGAILLVDEFEDILRVEAVNGIFPPPYEAPDQIKLKISSIQSYFKSIPIKIGETILGEAAKIGRPIFVRNTVSDDRMANNTKNDTLYISSIIVIPLLVSKRILGVLSIIKRERGKFFTENDFDHIKTFADYASLTIDFIMTYMELIEKREMERELGIAAEIQQKLLPNKIPKLDKAAIGAFSIPAKGVSGDYFDILPLQKDKVAMVICDVAGKGVPAALVMVMIRSILHLITSADKDARTIVTWINRGITGRIDIDHFATLSFMIYDQNSGKITYSNAAHHPLLIYRKKTGKLESIDTEGLPIGIERGTKYEQKSFKIDTGDVAVLYTDGIIEAMNSDGEQYSFESLAKVVLKNAHLSPNDLIDKIKADLKVFVGNAPQHDDQTLLLMKVN
jgi:sigma-B regulation protein RsbU (phosphoserine phosphatase)